MIAKKSTCVLFCAIPMLAFAAPESLRDCALIADNGARLACFDRVASDDAGQGRGAAQPAPAPSPALVPATPPADSSARITPSATSSYLSDRWELGAQDKRGVFSFRPHRANYLLATYTRSPNNAPYRPFQALVPDSHNLSHAELTFQLGFKTKILENPADLPADLWFGYTQQSFWQASNRSASSPFRESNYQPELMAVLPTRLDLFGTQLRFVNLGLVHQSNGQASTLSRSWNRVYVQTGLERGEFSLLARVWKRLDEAAATDNNPDIVDYMGHGDLAGTYRLHGHEFTALARHNFRTNKGALQLGWAFPLSGHLSGYVQLFTGYGQSLIDYNYSQKVIGVGVMLTQ
jgi:phospholipase A1